MHFLAIFGVALAISGETPQAAPQDPIDPAVVEAPRRWPGVVPTDFQLKRQLDAMLQTHPDKVICVNVVRAGSRLPHPACRTLRGWYDFEADRDTAANVAKFAATCRPESGMDPVGGTIGPPYELMEHIKDLYQNPRIRRAALAREKARLSAASAPRPASPATPPVSNP